MDCMKHTMKGLLSQSKVAACWNPQPVSEPLKPSQQHQSVTAKDQRHDEVVNLPKKSDLIVVLDLDECLYSAPRSYEEFKAKAEVETMFVDGLVENFSLRVLLRPHAIKFLKDTTSRYETHIFTAGDKSHADIMVNKLCELVGNPNAFAGRWYTTDCEKLNLVGFHVTAKPLAKITGGNLKRVVHVDDRAENFLRNHENGIPVSAFKGCPNDDALLEVSKVLKELEEVDDVRPFLHEKYGGEASGLVLFLNVDNNH